VTEAQQVLDRLLPREGQALRSWVMRERTGQTVEVGLGYGIATLFVCDGLLATRGPAARHVAIDPYQETRFGGCGLVAVEGRSFDLAFVDGNHRFDAVFLDLVYLGRLVRRGGIVFVGDYQLPAIARAVSFCLTNLGWTREETGDDGDLHHWAVLRTSERADARSFDDYVEF